MMNTLEKVALDGESPVIMYTLPVALVESVGLRKRKGALLIRPLVSTASENLREQLSMHATYVRFTAKPYEYSDMRGTIL